MVIFDSILGLRFMAPWRGHAFYPSREAINVIVCGLSQPVPSVRIPYPAAAVIMGVVTGYDGGESENKELKQQRS